MCVLDFESALDNALKEMKDRAFRMYYVCALKVDAEVRFDCIEEYSCVWDKKVKHASLVTLAYDRFCLSFDGKEQLPEIPACICKRLWTDVESDKRRVKLAKKIIGGLQTFLCWLRFIDFCFYYNEECFCEYCMEYLWVKGCLDECRYNGVKLWETFSANFRENFIDKWLFCLMKDITSKKSRFYSRLKCVNALRLYDVVEKNFIKCTKICYKWNSVMRENCEKLMKLNVSFNSECNCLE